MQSTRGAAILAAVAVLTGGLAACGDDSEPEESTTTASPIDPSKSSSSTSESAGSETRGSEVAPLPEAATQKTKEGAIAFNEFYQLQMGEALKTADSATLREYSDGCAVCDELAKTADTFKKDKVRATKNPYSIRKSSARPRTDGGYRVEMDLELSEYRKKTLDGQAGPLVKAVDITVVSNTQWVNGQWKITDLVRTQ